jgi:hypothetical protein
VATRNPEAYALYLQATAIFNRRDGHRFRDGIAEIEQAVRLDPDMRGRGPVWPPSGA